MRLFYCGIRDYTRQGADWLSVLLAGVSLFVSAACTFATQGLSLPSKSSSPQTVIVSLNTWHAMLAFPVPASDDSQHVPQEYEEWGYAERGWYLEGKTGVSGIVRALFWPTEGVVEVGRHPSVWAERTPQPPAEVFVFPLEREAFSRIRAFLESSISSRTAVSVIGDSVFYPSVRSYHLFHTCHHYAARALKAAGLPIMPFLAFNRTMLQWQLQQFSERTVVSP